MMVYMYKCLAVVFNYSCVNVRTTRMPQVASSMLLEDNLYHLLLLLQF